MRSKNYGLILSISIWLSSLSFATEKLTIISPHRKSIQREFIPLFEKQYKEKYKKEVKVEWIDQGGTESDLRFVMAKYQKNPMTAGIDIFWGGGDLTFNDLENQGYLENLPLSVHKAIPKEVVGIPLHSQNQKWIATAISSFGIFYNKRLAGFQKLKNPQTWEDLGKPEFFNMVSIADPRRSSSSLVMIMIILNSLGWEKGWATLTKMSGNVRMFTHSSSDPIKAVVSGDVVAATAIDFYAAAKIASIGKQNLGYALPKGKTVFNSDPVAILKGAPNKIVAERFVEFVISPEAQRLLILKKGSQEGPKLSLLGRMAINPKAYQIANSRDIISSNPFALPASKLKIDLEKLTKEKIVVGDLIGAIFCDTHKELQKAWKAAIKRGLDSEEVAILTQPPLSKKELEQLIDKWSDPVVRNKTINEWVKKAKSRYQNITSAGSI